MPGSYLALLRGINVGGKNVIKMAELRACFEAEGFRDVATYIQSGNVLFTARAVKRADLTSRIETALGARFDYRASVVLRTRQQLRTVVTRAPDGFGDHPSTFRYDVVFLKEPLTARTAVERVATRDGVDRVYPGVGVLYCSRLISKASKSHLSRLASLPIYRSMTIRNWNTTTTLLRMMEALP